MSRRDALAADLASTLAASAARCGDPLASTWRLIARAFPGGVPHDAIDALIALLYDHMSDRQLGVVVAALSGVDSEVATNRIYRVAAADAQPGRLDDVRRQLADAGLDDWMGE